MQSTGPVRKQVAKSVVRSAAASQPPSESRVTLHLEQFRPATDLDFDLPMDSTANSPSKDSTEYADAESFPLSPPPVQPAAVSEETAARVQRIRDIVAGTLATSPPQAKITSHQSFGSSNQAFPTTMAPSYSMLPRDNAFQYVAMVPAPAQAFYVPRPMLPAPNYNPAGYYEEYDTYRPQMFPGTHAVAPVATASTVTSVASVPPNAVAAAVAGINDIPPRTSRREAPHPVPTTTASRTVSPVTPPISPPRNESAPIHTNTHTQETKVCMES